MADLDRHVDLNCAVCRTERGLDHPAETDPDLIADHLELVASIVRHAGKDGLYKFRVDMPAPDGSLQVRLSAGYTPEYLAHIDTFNAAIA